MLGTAVQLPTSGHIGMYDRKQLEAVMAYDNHAVVHRLAKERDITLSEAELLFADTRRFLFLCSMPHTAPLVPPEAIDEGWHTFLLFTADYLEFCQTFFGRFLHHRPRRPEDPPGDGSGIRETFELAHVVFGDLSVNWDMPQVRMAGDCTPSTACQDAPPSDCALNVA